MMGGVPDSLGAESLRAAFSEGDAGERLRADYERAGLAARVVAIEAAA